jgi:hypothetical protein
MVVRLCKIRNPKQQASYLADDRSITAPYRYLDPSFASYHDCPQANPARPPSAYIQESECRPLDVDGVSFDNTANILRGGHGHLPYTVHLQRNTYNPLNIHHPQCLNSRNRLTFATVCFFGWFQHPVGLSVAQNAKSPAPSEQSDASCIEKYHL